jgi:hypothetical protein
MTRLKSCKNPPGWSLGAPRTLDGSREAAPNSDRTKERICLTEY